ncbi:MAG TPA: hypothetical protein VI911_11785 [Patescibacteria group bacterium]|nr:hypothetical protein [Patescibacteria group bacterium]
MKYFKYKDAIDMYGKSRRTNFKKTDHYTCSDFHPIGKLEVKLGTQKESRRINRAELGIFEYLIILFHRGEA